MTGLMRGRADVGVVRSCAGLDLPSLLVDFHKEFPAVEVTLSKDNSDHLVDGVRQGRIDAAIVALTATEPPPGIGLHVVADEAFVVVVSPGDQLAQCSSIAGEGACRLLAACVRLGRDPALQQVKALNRGDGRGRHPPQERPRPSHARARAAARTHYSARPAVRVTPSVSHLCESRVSCMFYGHGRAAVSRRNVPFAPDCGGRRTNATTCGSAGRDHRQSNTTARSRSATAVPDGARGARCWGTTRS